jgi:hypothetical protein
MKYLKKFNEIKMFGDSDESEYEGPMVPSSWKEGNDKDDDGPMVPSSWKESSPPENKPTSQRWAIFAGLGGGFGGANFTGEIFTGTREQAESRAYGAAQEEYEQYEGNHGLRSSSDIMDEDGVDEEEAEQIRNEEMESWLDYWVEPYDPSKHTR